MRRTHSTARTGEGADREERIARITPFVPLGDCSTDSYSDGKAFVAPWCEISNSAGRSSSKRSIFWRFRRNALRIKPSRDCTRVS